MKKLMLVFILVLSPGVKASGIPVVDIVGNIRGTLQLVEDLAQTIGQTTQIANQVSQLTNQLTQIQNQYNSLKNLGSYSFQDYKNILAQLDSVAQRTGALAFATSNLASEYDNYKDYKHYQGITDYSAAYDAANDRWAINSSETTKSSAGVLQQQHQSLTTDANTLANLQNASKGVSGEVQAQQAGNQLASFSAGQLMQMRQLMMNQQQYQLQERAQKAEKKALEQAQWKKTTDQTTNNSEPGW